MTLLIAHRNAVSVLPLPVGARISVDSPRAIAGQPWACGGVGAAKEGRDPAATAGWKSSRTSGARFATALFSAIPRHLSGDETLPCILTSDSCILSEWVI